MADEKKADAEKAEAAKVDKERVEKAEQAKKTEAAKAAGSSEGARSVADAVKRVADAAVAEISKVKVAPAGDFIFTGTPGGRFHIRGSGFGPSGTVTVGGRQVRTRGWGATEIEGDMPADVQSGEVVVHVDDKTQLRADYVRT